MRLKKIYLTFIFFITFSFPCFSAVNSFFALDELTGDDKINTDIDDLRNMYEFAVNNFLYDDIDYDKIYEAMASAMLDAFDDKWTQYIPKDKSGKYNEVIRGKFTGIGVYLTKTAPQKQKADDDKSLYVQITSCFNNSPASKAGIRSGDLITHINGESVIEKTATECSELLRGKKGTIVTVTVKRKNVTFDTTITRDEITTPSVEAEMLDNSILYLRINSFAENTSSQVEGELNKYSNPKGIIIDLRNNGGGEVNNCVKIADFFLPSKKLIVSSESKVESRRKKYYSTSEMKVPTRVPLVVLINNGTASASEILSAALKENDRATLVGEKTYGKGVIQISVPWREGFVNVTTAEYKTPLGNKVHEVGIQPDYEVIQHELSDEESNLLIELENEKIATTFIENEKELNIENVNKCVNLIKSNPKYSSLDDQTLSHYVFMLYYLELDDDKRKIAWPEFDSVLNKGMEILKEKI